MNASGMVYFSIEQHDRSLFRMKDVKLYYLQAD